MLIGLLPGNMPAYVAPFKVNGLEVQDLLGTYVAKAEEEALAEEITDALNRKYANTSRLSSDEKVEDILGIVKATRDRILVCLSSRNNVINDFNRMQLSQAVEHLGEMLGKYGSTVKSDDIGDW